MTKLDLNNMIENATNNGAESFHANAAKVMNLFKIRGYLLSCTKSYFIINCKKNVFTIQGFDIFEIP
jgi:hypothetical protein